MPKFRSDERAYIKNIVANCTITRQSDNDIIKEIERQIGKSISLKQIYNIRQSIKKESFDWYRDLQQGKYEYIHQFRTRIREVLDLQKRHYSIVNNPSMPIHVKQLSLFELHKLNITLANYYDVAPEIINGSCGSY